MNVMNVRLMICWLLIVTSFAVSAALAGDLSKLPVLDRPVTVSPPSDYLIDADFARAGAYRDASGKLLILDNGLIRRTWRLEPNGACVAFDNLMNGQSMLRSIRPEARVTINGVAYDVGGLVGQPNHAYLTPEWLETMTSDPAAMQLVGFEVGQPTERLAWGRVRHTAPQAVWPPKGIALRLDFVPSTKQPTGVRVSVHYELYDGIPALSKRITVRNESGETVSVDRLTAEELAIVEYANWVETREGVDIPPPEMLHVETDFAFGGFNHENANRHVVHWRTDPLFSTQVNWTRDTPCRLVVEPTYGPAQDIEAGEEFTSFHVFELVYDGSDRERRGLALRRMYRTLAPWITENPITHHLINSDPQVVRRAIDQAAEVGFEAVIMSFGSGFNMESTDQRLP